MVSSLLYFFSYLFLLPFFLRIIFRYHRLPIGHPLYYLVLQLTNFFIYPIAKILPPTLYIDRPAILTTLLITAFFTHLKCLFQSVHLFFEVLLVVTLLDWCNRLIILYVALGVLRILTPLLALPKALELLIDELTDPAVNKIIFFSRALPQHMSFFIKKYSLFVFVALLMCAHISFEIMMLQRMS